ncbi:MAG: RluA family pseudouridine synthase [Saprospiraceae bacterium]|nr:RluA family pseudouridine synthase [Saprospiraceae bacterium]
MSDISSLIIFKDRHLLVANKPPLMPVQEDKTGDPSLYRLLCAYTKHNLYPCTRIDRPVSGLVIFGKNPEDQTLFQAIQDDQKLYKEYLAIVPLCSSKEPVKLEHRLIHDAKLHKAFVSDKPEAKPASLIYEVVLNLERYSVLKITTSTGRFHQIRCQLAAVGLHIKGDVKYGARRANKDRSIGLHAWKIEFPHPVTGVKIQLEAPLPSLDIWPQINIPSSTKSS